MEKLTNNFYVVSCNVINNSFGMDNICKSLDECYDYIDEVFNSTKNQNVKYVFEIFEYYLSNDELKNIDYSVDSFFDNIDEYSKNYLIVDMFIK